MRLALTISVLMLAACTAREPAPTPAPRNDPLSRACRFLWSQQSVDGGWHSDTYGLMRSGQSLTPYVLHALLQTPAEFRDEPQGARDRALAFIRSNVNADGALGMADKMVMDYPTHSTAFAIRCLVLAGNKQDLALIDRMCDWLTRHQFSKATGFEEKHAAFGGFGFGGTGVVPERPGIMDVVHTRNAMQALREAGRAGDDICKAAQSFLRLVQRHPDDKRPQPPVPGEAEGPAEFDGGFYFSPVVLGMNKGLFEKAREGRGAYFRSYATATCDGLLALLAAGVPMTDERAQAALKWLRERQQLDSPPGIPQDSPTPWQRALWHYHLAVRAEALAAVKEPGDWRPRIREALAPRQRADGSFINEESPLMKEDDPILCTAFCVIALARCAP